MTTDARMEKVATGVRGRGVWEHFTVLDGLPDMKVECLAEDRDGMIWVGTHDGGAARYDGEHFECFSSDDGLSCDSVYSITEGLDGIIWFGTSRGLTKYDGKTFEVIDGSQEYSFLWGACVDDDGVLWFGLDRRPGKPAGVIRCDGGAVQLIEAEEEPSISIHSMVLLEGAVIATGHRGYVASEGMTPLQWQRKDVRCMVPTSRRSALAVSAEGVFRVSLTEVERISREPAGESVAAGQGRAWVATRNGRLLLVADGEIADEEVSPLPTLWRGAMVSKNGGLWLSSFGAGISCYDSVVQTVLDARHLPDSSILSLAYSRDGTLWMGLATGLRALNTDGVMYAPMAGHILSSKPVTSLCATESGELWVGTRQGSVFTIEDFTIWAHEAPPELSALSVADIVSDGPTVYYRGPGSRAFGTLAPTLRRISHVGGAVMPEVTAISARAGGGVWVGGRDESGKNHVMALMADGSVEMDYKVEHTSTAILDTGERLIIGSTRTIAIIQSSGQELQTKPVVGAVTSIAKGVDQRFYVGTEGGGVISIRGDAVRRIPLPRDEELMVANDIVIDDAGQRLAIATSKGVVRVGCDVRLPVITRIEAMGCEITSGGLISVEAGQTLALRVEATSPKWPRRALRLRWRVANGEWRSSRCDARVALEAVGLQQLIVQVTDPDHSVSEERSIVVRVTDDAKSIGYQDTIKSSVAGGIYGKSSQTRALVKRASTVADTNVSVLILGESGTGKGVIARQVHDQSARAQGPFIQVNCGALSEGLVDSELFGHEKGAFTGAVRARAGAFELSHGGTLFLDEIGDLPIDCQAHLLHVLQDGTIRRVGGEKTKVVDVRLIAATNRDLENRIITGHFRQDLFFRLAVLTIDVPPLRQRIEDLPALIEHFLELSARRTGKPVPVLTADALGLLETYAWPGNIRELEHAILSAVVLADSVVEPQHLPLSRETADISVKPKRLQTLDEHQREYIEHVLEHTDGKVDGSAGAACILNVNSSTLRSRMRRLGVQRDKSGGAK